MRDWRVEMARAAPAAPPGRSRPASGRGACRCRRRPRGRDGRRGRSCARAGRWRAPGRSGSRRRWRGRGGDRAPARPAAGRPRGSAGCCRRDASSRRQGTCRGCRARAPPCRWPRPPIRAMHALARRQPNTVAPPWPRVASAMARAETTGRRLMAASATAALSMIAVDDHLSHVLARRRQGRRRRRRSSRRAALPWAGGPAPDEPGLRAAACLRSLSPRPTATVLACARLMPIRGTPRPIRLT